MKWAGQPVAANRSSRPGQVNPLWPASSFIARLAIVLSLMILIAGTLAMVTRRSRSTLKILRPRDRGGRLWRRPCSRGGTAVAIPLEQQVTRRQDALHGVEEHNDGRYSLTCNFRSEPAWTWPRWTCEPRQSRRGSLPPEVTLMG